MTHSAKEILERARGRVFETEDDEVVAVELLPPATAEEIAALEASLPGPLPTEVKDLLAFTSGLDLGADEIDFLGGGVSGQFLDGASSHQHDIMGDGTGNSWFVDVRSDGTWGGVFFANHDPPVMLLQSADLATFLEDVLRAHESRASDGGELITSTDPKDVWGENPLARAAVEVRGAGDGSLRAFASEVPDDALVVDLRAAEPGDGFAWGCFGPRTEIRRSGDELLFALVPPPPAEPRRRGLLSRLLGR